MQLRTAFAWPTSTPANFAAFPEFAFDSWLTIGAEDNTIQQCDIISLDDPTYAAFFEDLKRASALK